MYMAELNPDQPAAMVMAGLIATEQRSYNQNGFAVWGVAHSIGAPDMSKKSQAKTSARNTSNSDAPRGITSMLHEDRVFPPKKDFSLRAHIKSLGQYQKLYKESITDTEGFWGRMAEKELVWFKPWKTVLKWKAPDAKWFVGGKTNVSYNCLDKHLDTPIANKAALIWEGEPAGPGKVGEERTLTYGQLHREVCQFANVVKRHGIKKGDRIIIYLPMVPEAAVAMFACSRIGAVHSVVFGGFSAQSVADRIFDCQAKLVITADGGYRRGAVVPVKKHVDDAP